MPQPQRNRHRRCLAKADTRFSARTRLHFIVEFPGTLNYVRTMSQELEKRVADLEKKVAEMSAEPTRLVRKKDWRRTFGIFKDDPDFEEAVRLGREYREQQTYEKEIAGS
jgi:hypothetical protein